VESRSRFQEFLFLRLRSAIGAELRLDFGLSMAHLTKKGPLATVGGNPATILPAIDSTAKGEIVQTVFAWF
jgi:hypothetical protein